MVIYKVKTIIFKQQTNLYRKSTDQQFYLHVKSEHSKALKIVSHTIKR